MQTGPPDGDSRGHFCLSSLFFLQPGCQEQCLGIPFSLELLSQSLKALALLIHLATPLIYCRNMVLPTIHSESVSQESYPRSSPWKCGPVLVTGGEILPLGSFVINSFGFRNIRVS